MKSMRMYVMYSIFIIPLFEVQIWLQTSTNSKHNINTPWPINCQFFVIYLLCNWSNFILFVFFKLMCFLLIILSLFNLPVSCQLPIFLHCSPDIHPSLFSSSLLRSLSTSLKFLVMRLRLPIYINPIFAGGGEIIPPNVQPHIKHSKCWAMLWNSISKFLKWSKVYGQSKFILRNISQGPTRAPWKLKVDNYGN